jgi:hypothetical protein
MKRPWLIVVLVLFFVARTLLAQTSSHELHDIPFLDASQSNVIVIVNALRAGNSAPQPPPAYTNLLSNTNLFLPVEQSLLASLPSKYKGVTTNSGPPGTTFIGLIKSTNGLVARFQYSN